MKAERRHELQTNALADWLSGVINQVKPHANAILIGALLIVGVAVAIAVISGRSAGKSESAWASFYEATSTEDVDKRATELEYVADQHAGTAPGIWARLMLADTRLLRGTNASFKDHVAGEEDLEKAKNDFLAVISDAESLPASERSMLLQRGHWGLAQTYNAQGQGEQAAEEYRKIASTWPDSALGKAAARQAEYVEGMSDWFEWYVSVDPTTIEPTATRRGQPPGVPMAPRNELPDDPDFSLPGPLGVPSSDDLDLGFDTEGLPPLSTEGAANPLELPGTTTRDSTPQNGSEDSSNPAEPSTPDEPPASSSEPNE